MSEQSKNIRFIKVNMQDIFKILAYTLRYFHDCHDLQ